MRGVDEAVVRPPARADGRARRRHDNARRLYDAADDLLRDVPFDEVSVDDICERAGVGRATFFRIYGTKAGLLREFNRRLTAAAVERLERRPAGDLAAALDEIRMAMVDAWARTGRGHAGMAAEFVRTLPSAEPHAAHPELLALVATQVERAIDTGELADDLPADLVASMALLTMVVPIGHRITGHEVDFDTVSARLLNRWLAGMRADWDPGGA
ncbi:MAG: TetR/AcrR family transcriptional regulator [Acidimicrobiales bacterium]